MMAYDRASGSESWVKGASFIATDDGDWAARVEAAHTDIITKYTLNYGFTGNFPKPDQDGGDLLFALTYGADHADVVAALNGGRNLVVYNGLGLSKAWKKPGFTQQDIREMTGPPIPLVIGLASDTADFSVVESLADSWVTQAGSGALVYIGSSASTEFDKNIAIEEGVFKNIFEQPGASIGETLNYAIGQLEKYPEDIRHYREAYQLFGDPSLKILLDPKTSDFSLTADPAHLGVCGHGQAVTSIQVEGRFGFSSQVDLAHPVLPEGTAGSIQPDSIHPGEQAILTLTNTSTPAGDYSLSVEGVSGPLLRQTGLLYSVYDHSPPQVALLKPAPFTPNAPLRPEFAWEGQNAFTYDLEVATDHEFNHIHIDVADLSEPRFTPADDLAPGTTYWWRVRAKNPCGEVSGILSLPRRFTTRAEADHCAAGGFPIEIFSADFEDQPAAWCPAQNPDGWSLVNDASHSPVNSCFASSSISIPGDTVLVTPQIQLPGPDQAPIQLSFWSNHVFENQLECKDGGLLEISLKDGINWTPIPEENLLTIPYDGLISSELQNPLGNQRAWCGTREWSRVAVLLDDYAGQSVRLRWRLGTDDSTQGRVEGWHVDDVSVSSCNYPPPPGVAVDPASSLRSGPPNRQVFHSLQVTNTGPEPASFTLQVEGGTWRNEIAPTRLNLDPGTSQLVSVRVTVPEQASPGGSDRATLIVFDANDSAVHATAQIETLVRFYQVALECMQPSLSGMPGSEVRFEATLRNTGSEADTYALTLSAPEGWAAELLPDVIILTPGDSETVQVGVKIPPGSLDGEQAIFTLKAQSDPGAFAQLDFKVTSAWPRLFLPLLGHW